MGPSPERNGCAKTLRVNNALSSVILQLNLVRLYVLSIDCPTVFHNRFYNGLLAVGWVEVDIGFVNGLKSTVMSSVVVGTRVFESPSQVRRRSRSHQ